MNRTVYRYDKRTKRADVGTLNTAQEAKKTDETMADPSRDSGVKRPRGTIRLSFEGHVVS